MNFELELVKLLVALGLDYERLVWLQILQSILGRTQIAVDVLRTQHLVVGFTNTAV